MIKYLLLCVPVFFFSNGIIYHNFEVIINLTIVVISLFFLLKLTSFNNLYDWVIGVCFSIYYCVLYEKTIDLKGVLLAFNKDYLYVSFENVHMAFNMVNLIPIKGVISVISNNISELNVLYQIIGNTLMLTPLAFAMLYFKWTKSYKKAFLISIICTLGIEFIQFLLNVYYIVFEIGMNRSVDIDDVFLNTIGAVIGIVFYDLWGKIKSFMKRKKPNIPI